MSTPNLSNHKFIEHRKYLLQNRFKLLTLYIENQIRVSVNLTNEFFHIIEGYFIQSSSSSFSAPFSKSVFSNLIVEWRQTPNSILSSASFSDESWFSN